MAIYFLKFSTGNGYRCGCCSRWQDHSDTVHADNVAQLVERVEDQMSCYDYDDGISFDGLISGASGIDYADHGNISSDFDKLLGARQASSKDRDVVRNFENAISTARRKFDAEKAKYDEQLKDGLIAQKGYDQWVGLERQNLDATLARIEPQLARAKAAVNTRTPDEIRASIIARIEELDKDYLDDPC